MPDNAGSDRHKPTSLRGIAITAASNKQHRFRNLYGLLNRELLYEGWKLLNKKAASGVDKVTAKEYSQNLLLACSSCQILSKIRIDETTIKLTSLGQRFSSLIADFLTSEGVKNRAKVYG